VTGEDWQQWAVPGAAWLLTYLIHSTVLIASVWLISRRLDGRPAALEALWKTALVGGLVTASLQTAAGLSPWGGRLALVSSSSSLTATGPASGPGRDSSRITAEAGSPLTSRWRRPTASALPEQESADAGRAPASSAAAGPLVGSLTEPRAPRAPHRSRASSAGEGGRPSAGAARASTAASSTPLASRDAIDSDLVGAGAAAAAATVPPAAAAAPLPASSTVADPRPVLSAAFLAWAVLAAFLGLGLLRSWLRLRRLLADRRPIEAGPASTMLARLTAGSSLGRRIRLSSSTRVDVPIAVGVLRPEIVVPERALYELEPAELESLLAHELAHLVRRDPAWRLLAGCFHRILFVQPLNRIATLQLESASEVLCDDWAVERTERPLALARCLTEVAGWVASPLGASVPAMARSGSGLGHRVRRLVAAGDGLSPRQRDRWPIPLAAGVLVLVVFAAPGATDTGGAQTPAAMPPQARLATISTGETPAAGSGAIAAPAPAAASAPAIAAAPSPSQVDRADEARRLLVELRSGKPGDHDISDWVALAQVLGSRGHRGLDDLIHEAGADGALLADSGAPLLSGEGLEDLISGALSRALGGGIDLGFDFDVDFHPHGGFDVHVGNIGDDDDDDADDDDEGLEGLDLDLELLELPDIDMPDVEVPDVDVDVDVNVDVSNVPGALGAPTPTPPPPPDAPGCHHGLSREAAREIQRQVMEAARVAQEQARAAIEQGRIARDEALRQAKQARRQAREAMRQADRDRERALAQAGQAREQALAEAERAREQALAQAQQVRDQALRQAREVILHGRQIREQLHRQLRQHEREMRRVQRDQERQQEEMQRAQEEQERQRERDEDAGDQL